ncbi:MAG: phytanoyl-CoA dioxygenase family protein [Arenicella sp.]|nr:phytanoyl-CoA dioxygenase family protein [Arenicella sp.]
MLLTFAQIQQFKIDGYLVLPSLLQANEVSDLRALTERHLVARIEPFELEAQVRYPGAPTSKDAAGGDTIRRLLMAFQRDAAFAQQASRREIVDGIKQILDANTVRLNPNHHNCIMTKQPTYSSETLWHRDTRYWNFSDKYLINAWFALGDEQIENGAMKILPGSHRWEVQEHALDDDQFLKSDHPDNQYRLATQRLVSLAKGDVLLFSAHCFHAAGENKTVEPKFSMVFTYHGDSTTPVNGTHSASRPEISV